MREYNPIKSYKYSKDRLMNVDWSSVAYHQWHSLVSKKNVNNFDMAQTSEAEIEVWKNLMVGRMVRYIRLFNPKDIIISLEGNGVIWRKTEYSEYYKKHTTIYYDKTGFYVKFDNFLYKVSKSPDGYVTEKLDPTTEILATKIEWSALSDGAKSVLSTVIPEYKGNRKKQEWKFLTEKQDWARIRDSFAYDVAKIFRAKVVMSPKAEGDDILYVATSMYVEKYSDIVMITGDSDFNQLLHYSNFAIINHQTDTMVTCVDPRKYLELKILSGDKSDNINGMALPGKKQQLGLPTAEKLLESVGSAYAAAEKDGWVNQYMRNRKLIDMTCMPTELYSEIRDQITAMNPVLGEWEVIYRLGITKKLINEITVMRDVGYYALHNIEEINKNPNLFKENLVKKDVYHDPADVVAPTYSYGVGNIFAS